MKLAALHRSVLALLALSCVLCQKQAASGQEPPNFDTEIDSFFRKLVSPDFRPDDAFNQLLADSPLAQRKEDVKKLIERFEGLQTAYGAYLAFEKIDSRFVGKDLVFFRYLYKAEKYPLAWSFAYYRAPNSEKWTLISVSFDTRLDRLVEGAAGN